jgi:hypothetical protein
MKTRIVLMMMLALAAGLVLVFTRSHRPPAAQKSEQQNIVTVRAVPASTNKESEPAGTFVNPAADEKQTAVAIVSASASLQPKLKKQKNGKLANAKAPIQDPNARVALSFVGADPDAEAYWASAINDPGLPAEERKDLIEDLNEDGLSDPKHPGPEDMPLIVNRLRLIDELAPYAMDQVNADAFQEAQKDLLALLDGRPVQ